MSELMFLSFVTRFPETFDALVRCFPSHGDSTDRASLRGSFGWEASFAALAAAAGRTSNDVPQLVEFSKFMKMKNLFDGMDYYPDSYVVSVVESMTDSNRRTFFERCFNRFGSHYYVALHFLETTSYVED